MTLESSYWSHSDSISSGAIEQAEFAKRPSMFFTPNMSGPLHIASAIVLWLSAREAKARGARLIIWLDDLPLLVDTPGVPRELRVQDGLTVDSARNACELLGIDAYFSRRSAYTARYLEVVDMLCDAGLAREVTPNVYIPNFLPLIEDKIQGLYGYNNLQFGTICLARTFVTAIDFCDFYTPLHIRGRDIDLEAGIEGLMLPFLMKVLGKRPPMIYAHIPEIYRGNGQGLHKTLYNKWGLQSGQSRYADDPYTFQTWAKRFSNIEDRRHALEQIVLMPNYAYSLENVRKEPILWVDVERKTIVALHHQNAIQRMIERRQVKGESNA